MAATVVITDDSSFPMNSLCFNGIVEFSRSFFDSDSKKFELEIYEPIDEGAMYYVYLTNQNSQGFMAFDKALDEAYKQSKALEKIRHLDEQYFGMVIDTWEELLSLLRSDSRFVGD